MDLNKQVKATVVPGRQQQPDRVDRQRPAAGGRHHVLPAGARRARRPTRPGSKSATSPAARSSPIAEDALQGGAAGRGAGLPRQHAGPGRRMRFGRVAIALAQTFNDQHALGLDANGNPGGDFFTIPPAEVTKNVNNNITSTTAITRHGGRCDPADHQRLQGRLRRQQLQRDPPVGQPEDRDLAVPADRAADHRRPCSSRSAATPPPATTSWSARPSTARPASSWR